MRVSANQACQLLRDGNVVAIPTETVYGLAAFIEKPKAIEKIFYLKNRPADNPLIIHLADIQNLDRYVLNMPEKAKQLMERFWPGPMTLILPVSVDNIPDIIRAGLPTAGFRIPNHPLALDVLKKVGPLVMPSANLSGKPSATTADHVENDFGSELPLVDGGPCHKGLESTILNFQNGRWDIIRQGALEAEAFEHCLGYIPEIKNKTQAIICPGQKYRHYAPEAKLILTKEASTHSGVVVGFDERNYSKADKIFRLGPISSPEVVAENLYAVLRQLDEKKISEASVDIDFPFFGLWKTVNDRLQKAAKKS